MENAISFKGKILNILKWIYSKLNIFLYCYLALVVLIVLFFLHSSADVGFHVQRFDAVVQEFENYGISAIPVRIYHVTCDGYGYASPLFYGDIFMWPFAGLSALFNIPVIWGYKLMLATVFIVVFFVAKYSISLVVKGKWFWLVFFFYIFNRIVFDNVVNGFLGRAYAMMFVPLTICSFISLLKDNEQILKHSILMGIGVAGCLFSNAIDAVIVVFSLFVLFLFLIKHLTWRKIGFIGLSVVVFLFVSAWFLLPMLEQMSSQGFFYNSESVKEMNDLTTATVPFLGIFLNSRILGKILALFGVESPYNLYFSGLIYYILLIVFTVVGIVKNRKEIKKFSDKNQKFKICTLYGLLFLLIIFTLFQTKLFPHDLLAPLISVIQFPFRTANVMALAASLVIIFICIFFKKRVFLVVLSLVLIVFNSMTAINSTVNGIKQLQISKENITYNSNTISFAEYLPEELTFDVRGEEVYSKWIQFKKERGDVVICSDEGVVLNSEKSFDTVTITYSNNINNATFELPYFYYKGYYAVNIETGEEYEVTKSKNGLVEITGIGNSGTVEVYYKGTNIQTASEIISGVGVFLIIGGIVVMKVINKSKYNTQSVEDVNADESIEEILES